MLHARMHATIRECNEWWCISAAAFYAFTNLFYHNASRYFVCIFTLICMSVLFIHTMFNTHNQHSRTFEIVALQKTDKNATVCICSYILFYILLLWLLYAELQTQICMIFLVQHSVDGIIWLATKIIKFFWGGNVWKIALLCFALLFQWIWMYAFYVPWRHQSILLKIICFRNFHWPYIACTQTRNREKGLI